MNEPKNARKCGSEDIVFELCDEASKRVLDIGCGSGGLVKALIARGHEAVGVEPLADGKDPLIKQAGAEKLPFQDQSFDLVTFCHSLHHVPEKLLDQALGEACRVLAPEGKLVVIEPLALGPFYHVMQPVDDEAPLYDLVIEAIHKCQDLSHENQSYIYGAPEYRNVDQLRRALIRVNPDRKEAPLSAWNEFNKRFHAAPKSWLFGKRKLKHFSRVDVFAKA